MTGFVESFVFGAANSVHCACMCGPLAVALHSNAIGSCWYHVGRATSYGSLGVVLGGMGAVLGASRLSTPTAWVSFVLAGALLMLALVGERGVLRIPWASACLAAVTRRALALPPALRGALLGLATPLLPCGLLWAVFGSATLAGSPIAGAAVMVGFALGSLPLLLFAQWNMRWLTRHFSPKTLSWVQRLAMLTAAAALLWRGSIAYAGESCCH